MLTGTSISIACLQLFPLRNQSPRKDGQRYQLGVSCVHISKGGSSNLNTDRARTYVPIESSTFMRHDITVLRLARLPAECIEQSTNYQS